MAGRLRPERLVQAFAALVGLIVLWNVAAYPAGAGYDAASHREYADFLIQHHRLPIRGETPEYYSPPLYYLVAGALTWVGRQIGLGDPHKLGQLLNVPAVVGTVLLVAALALAQSWYFHYHDLWAVGPQVWTLLARNLVLVALFAVLTAELAGRRAPRLARRRAASPGSAAA